MRADIPSISAAAATASEVQDDFRVSITNAAGPNVYPISSFAWFLIPEGLRNSAKREYLYEFLFWMLTSGQHQATALGYVSVPRDLPLREQAALARMRTST